jgi:hypothetical protein
MKILVQTLFTIMVATRLYIKLLAIINIVRQMMKCVSHKCGVCVRVAQIQEHLKSCPHWQQEQTETIESCRRLAKKHQPAADGPVHVNTTVHIKQDEERPHSMADLVALALHVLKDKERWQAIRKNGTLRTELKNVVELGEHLDSF